MVKFLLPMFTAMFKGEYYDMPEASELLLHMDAVGGVHTSNVLLLLQGAWNEGEELVHFGVELGRLWSTVGEPVLRRHFVAMLHGWSPIHLKALWKSKRGRGRDSPIYYKDAPPMT